MLIKHGSRTKTERKDDDFVEIQRAFKDLTKLSGIHKRKRQCCQDGWMGNVGDVGEPSYVDVPPMHSQGKKGHRGDGHGTKCVLVRRTLGLGSPDTMEGIFLGGKGVKFATEPHPTRTPICKLLKTAAGCYRHGEGGGAQRSEPQYHGAHDRT